MHASYRCECNLALKAGFYFFYQELYTTLGFCTLSLKAVQSTVASFDIEFMLMKFMHIMPSPNGHSYYGSLYKYSPLKFRATRFGLFWAAFDISIFYYF
jgi:hypothetical protein